MHPDRQASALQPDHGGRWRPVAAWLHAPERSWAHRHAINALLGAFHRTRWYQEPRAWLEHDALLRIVVCATLLDPELHVGIQAATRRPGRVLVATTDIPQRVHVLLPTGAHDAFCLPEQQALMGQRVEALLARPCAPDLLRALAEECGGALAAGFRVVAECLDVGAPPPPRSIEKLAARVGCSRGYLSALASGWEVPLGEILKCSVALRALDEHVSGAGPWADVAHVLGYSDTSGLRKLLQSVLGSSNPGSSVAARELVVSGLADLTRR